GITWTERLEKIAFDAIAFHPENPDLMWLGSFVQNEGERVTQLFKSFDGGDSWVLVPVNWTDFHTNNINAIEINPYNPDHIIVLEENEIAISYDGGASWENFVSHDPTV